MASYRQVKRADRTAWMLLSQRSHAMVGRGHGQWSMHTRIGCLGMPAGQSPAKRTFGTPVGRLEGSCWLRLLPIRPASWTESRRTGCDGASNPCCQARHPVPAVMSHAACDQLPEAMALILSPTGRASACPRQRTRAVTGGQHRLAEIGRDLAVQPRSRTDPSPSAVPSKLVNLGPRWGPQTMSDAWSARGNTGKRTAD
jgi:hypothetical protein